jgi:hypothetical protein
MHLDHISFAAGPDGLTATAARLGEALGATFLDGGIHPRFGTRNMILPLKNQRYLEVVEVLEHPAAEKVAFGQLVRSRSEAGGGWMGWAVAVSDLSPVEKRLGRHAVAGNRRRPDGFSLEWLQIGTSDKLRDPQLPSVTQWITGPEEHPSRMAEPQVSLVGLDIAGNRDFVANWFDVTDTSALEDVDFRWVAPNGAPGILAAEFDTPLGLVTI